MLAWMWWFLSWALISELRSCSRQSGNCADCGKFYFCMDISSADSQSRYWHFNVLWRKQHIPLPSMNRIPISFSLSCDSLILWWAALYIHFLVSYIISPLITHFPHILSMAEESGMVKRKRRVEVKGQRRESLHPGTYAPMAANITATNAPLSHHGAPPCHLSH